ncbi:lipase [Microbulbifer sp. CAU 1566]|uniref:lipase family alpha/beta hydrolase n=1 Tax=Microbulbifer sp. CAU 1566 TaxID=2933269 RepID=UPI0020067EF1|nr:lipase [Microbulbifer sp. CAU 1566]MCK7595938.1 lipase [Microbulbifer sp. CAU 1566]
MPKSRVAILIPGIFDRGKSMRRMEGALDRAGFVAHSINLKTNSGWYGMEPMAQQLGELVEEVTEKGDTCALVGFSMGGIVARYYLQRLGGAEKVHKFIALSSPHFGSLWAHLLPYKGGRQLRIGSEFLSGLNRDAAMLESAAPVSIWTPYDTTIVPHTSSRLPLGKTYQVPVSLHRWVPQNPAVIDIVSAELADVLKASD